MDADAVMAALAAAEAGAGAGAVVVDVGGAAEAAEAAARDVEAGGVVVDHGTGKGGNGERAWGVVRRGVREARRCVEELSGRRARTRRRTRMRMRMPPKAVALGVVVVLVVLYAAISRWRRRTHPVPTSLEEAVALARAGGRGHVPFVDATDAEFAEWSRAGEAWIRWALNPHSSPHASDKQRPPPPRGYVVESFPPFVVLRENPAKRRGGPGLIVRTGRDAIPLVLECPHSFFDAKTMPISLELLRATRAVALVFNTVHRSDAVSDDEAKEDTAKRAREGKSHADVAHNPRSLFQAAHVGLVRAVAHEASVRERALVLQIHGFRDDLVPTADVVVSGANTRGVELVPRLASSLRDAVPGIRVLHSPLEVPRLAASTNVQGHACRAAGVQFLHAEMSHTWRVRMTTHVDTPVVVKAWARVLRALVGVEDDLV